MTHDVTWSAVAFWYGASARVSSIESCEPNQYAFLPWPYLGPVNGFYTDWTPLNGRPGLFPEDIDTSDPWQFRNVLVG